MPRVPLLDLLGEREIVHPSTVKKIAYSNGALEIDICGYPWWLPKRKAQQMCDSHALIEFRDISHANLTESVLHNDSLAEDLEEFNLEALSLAEWNKGHSTEVFCSEPVEAMLPILSALDQHLIDQNCPFSWQQFVNFGHSISEFLEPKTFGSFKLCEGPAAICEVVAKELDKMNVKHTQITSHRPFFSGILMRWWDSYLISDDATISWD